jgi:cytochrome c oxidase assembly factor CtaG
VYRRARAGRGDRAAAGRGDRARSGGGRAAPIYRQWYRPEPTLVIAAAPLHHHVGAVVVAAPVPLYSAMYTPAPVVVVERQPAAVIQTVAAPEPAPVREGVTVEGEVRFQYNR